LIKVDIIINCKFCYEHLRVAVGEGGGQREEVCSDLQEFGRRALEGCFCWFKWQAMYVDEQTDLHDANYNPY
jgi:hypothetical protein